MNSPIVVTGYVGNHPDIRQTQESVITTPRYQTISEVCELAASPTHLRDAWVLPPLYTCGSGKTERHVLVVLPEDQRRIRFPRRGDLVTVQGRPRIAQCRAHGGAIREIHHLVVERLRVIAPGALPHRTVLLTGYLGADPEPRLTQERTFTVSWQNRVAEMQESMEVRTRAREFLVLCLYTHDHGRTERHRLVVWSSDQLCHRNIRWLRKGDRVRVKGRTEDYSYPAADGTTRTLRQVIVERMRLLARHRSHLAPRFPSAPPGPRRAGEAPASRGEVCLPAARLPSCQPRRPRPRPTGQQPRPLPPAPSPRILPRASHREPAARLAGACAYTARRTRGSSAS